MIGFIEISTTLASGIGSCVRYVATHFFGMTVSDDDIRGIVQREIKRRNSGR